MKALLIEHSEKRTMENTPTTVNCAEACVNGCVLGDKCPNQEYIAQANKFMNETSLDKMLEIAEAARLKKLTAPPQWVLPED
jgi:hypothetical protein